MEYPKQEIKTGNSKLATVSRRDVVAIRADAAPGGASNPQYTQELGSQIMAEILQVSGGEVVRGKQVEANTSFVVSIRWISGLAVDAKCEVEVLSGVYAGQKLYTRRVHFETERSRPKGIQLHCSTRE